MVQLLCMTLPLGKAKEELVQERESLPRDSGDVNHGRQVLELPRAGGNVVLGLDREGPASDVGALEELGKLLLGRGHHVVRAAVHLCEHHCHGDAVAASQVEVVLRHVCGGGWRELTSIRP